MQAKDAETSWDPKVGLLCAGKTALEVLRTTADGGTISSVEETDALVSILRSDAPSEEAEVSLAITKEIIDASSPRYACISVW